MPDAPGSWPKQRLGNLTTKIGSGATPRGGKESYRESGIALIRSMNVHDLRFDYDDLAFISDAQAAALSNVEVNASDVLLNITGASVARCCMVPEAVLPARVNQHVAIVRADPCKADARFISYCLNSPQYKHHLLTLAQGGATREALTKKTIEDFEIPCPTLETQRQIAGILSAYDDLIENNTRRIRILEEMAQSLYREWFIHFRYPGHEHVPLVDSSAGPIPEGWEVVPLAEMYDTSSGGTPSRKIPEYYAGSIPWVKTRELRDDFVFETEEHITEVGLAKSSAKLFPSGTVVMAMYGATIGKLGILALSACTNQACCAVLPEGDTFGREFGYFMLRESREKLISLGAGAAQQNISQKVIREFPVLKPAVTIAAHYAELAGPMLDQVAVLQQQRRNLVLARNHLLPELVSGELDVNLAGSERETLLANIA